MTILRTLCVAALACSCAAQASTAAPAERSEQPPIRTQGLEPEVVEYRMSPVIDGDVLTALAIEMRFRGDASGTTRVELPTEWASERELWKYVRDVQVEGAQGIADDGPAVRVIQAEPAAALVLRYRIVSAYDHEPTSDDGQPFAPIVRPTWFYGFGEALFAAPEGRDGTPARFDWIDAPPGFGFASDLEQLAAMKGTVGDVRNSISLGGTATRIYTEPVGDAALRVAMLGEYPYTHAAFVAMAKTIVAAEREFWGEHGEPFTIVVAPLLAVEGHQSLGGTGRGDAFAIQVSADSPIEPMRHLLAHEYFHTWNSARLGGQQGGDAEMLGKWFAEGFTEFYTWRLLLRSGLYRLEDFVAAWNTSLLEYTTSPARNEPNALIVKDYWTDPAVGKLPYRRGPMLAAIWDRHLREATGGARGLDDVMHAMRAKIRDAGARVLAPDAASLFLPTYVELGGPDLAADFARFVERGETIVLPKDVFGACVQVETGRRPTFDLGFDAEATRAANNVVHGLRQGSPAHRAGLRDGMTILRRLAGTRGDATVPYQLRVTDGKRERTITFLPRGRGELELQQLRIVGAKSTAEREACTRIVAGIAP